MTDFLQHRAQVAELMRFLDALHVREAGGLIEVRYRPLGGAMSQRFHRADRPEIAAELILLLAEAHDVYFGCAPGGAAGVGGVRSSGCGRSGQTATALRQAGAWSPSSHGRRSSYGLAQQPTATPTGRSQNR